MALHIIQLLKIKPLPLRPQRPHKRFYFQAKRKFCVCLFIFIAGCAPAERQATGPEVKQKKQTPKAAKPEAAKLAFKFTSQDSTTYRVTTQAERSVKWEGPLPHDVDSRENRKNNKIELIFTRFPEIAVDFAFGFTKKIGT